MTETTGFSLLSTTEALPAVIYYIGVRLVLSLLCLVLLTGCYGRSKPSSIGNAAPDFSIQDADHSVSLNQLRGKIVVLNFWATWCLPCLEEMPSLVQLQKKFQGTDVQVLAVSVDDDADAYHQFLKEHNIELLTVRDPGQRFENGVNSPVASRYGTFKFPETYIIDRQGIIRRKFIGAIDWNQPEIVEYLSRL